MGEKVSSVDAGWLDLPGATFFGIEEHIFRSVTLVARAGPSAVAEIGQLP